MKAELGDVRVHHVGDPEGDGVGLIDVTGVPCRGVRDLGGVRDVDHRDGQVLSDLGLFRVLACDVDDHGDVEVGVGQLDHDGALGRHVVLVVDVQVGTDLVGDGPGVHQ